MLALCSILSTAYVLCALSHLKHSSRTMRRCTKFTQAWMTLMAWKVFPLWSSLLLSSTKSVNTKALAAGRMLRAAGKSSCSRGPMMCDCMWVCFAASAISDTMTHFVRTSVVCWLCILPGRCTSPPSKLRVHVFSRTGTLLDSLSCMLPRCRNWVWHGRFLRCVTTTRKRFPQPCLMHVSSSVVAFSDLHAYPTLMLTMRSCSCTCFANSSSFSTAATISRQI